MRFQDFITTYMMLVHNLQFCCGIHSEEETELEAFSLENSASKMDDVSKNLTQEEDIAKFLESLPLYKKSPEILEIKTRGQRDNDL